MKAQILLSIAAVLYLSHASYAGSRTGESYTVTTEIVDGGGGRSAGGLYTNTGSIGSGGISSGEGVVGRHGFAGQLYDVAGLELLASPGNVPEEETTRLSARALLDDDTRLDLAATQIEWSIESGPVDSITAEGLATAGAVYADTAATAGGAHGGFFGTVELLVLDTAPDNFGMYAGDNLPDSWQVQHFGEENPLAAPGVDVTGNGHTNFFAWLADLIPTDHHSVFRVAVEPGANASEKRIVYSPRRETRHYAVIQSESVTNGSWSVLTPASLIDQGEQRTETDPNAGGGRKFYRVQISLPQ
jgi:hypothetical protein